MNPLVSVIITTYNKAPYLEQSVNSVLAQTYNPVECIIVDDGSTDETATIAQRLTQRDPRITYQVKPNGGVSSARNAGLQLARGEWIQFLDADDWIAEDKIERQIAGAQQFAESHGHSNLIVYSDYERVYYDRHHTLTDRRLCQVGELTPQQLIQRLLICPDFLANSPFPLLQQCLLIHRSLLATLPFDPTLNACEDREFALTLLLQQIPLVYVPMVAAFYRKHPTNLTDNDALMRRSYLQFFAMVSAQHPELRPLCQTSLHFLLNKAVEAKDTQAFRQLQALVQFPLTLKIAGQTVSVRGAIALHLLYLLRSILPNALLYERYRGPRSKKILSLLQRS